MQVVLQCVHMVGFFGGWVGGGIIVKITQYSLVIWKKKPRNILKVIYGRNISFNKYPIIDLRPTIQTIRVNEKKDKSRLYFMLS